MSPQNLDQIMWVHWVGSRCLTEPEDEAWPHCLLSYSQQGLTHLYRKDILVTGNSKLLFFEGL